jgi:flagellar basal-body rod modification protein FlgD
MATTTPISGSGTGATVPTNSGPKSLSSGDFMNLMINQLQHQDPMNPTDSNTLLQQIAEISTLQSNQSLQTSLSSLTLQQSIGAGGNLIGKAVQGLDANGNPLDGQVTGVKIENDKVLLTLNNNSQTTLPMENLITISQPVLATTGGTTSTDPTQTPTAAPGAAQSDIANAIMNALAGFTS